MTLKAVATLSARTSSQSVEIMCHLTEMERPPKDTVHIVSRSAFIRSILKDFSRVIQLNIFHPISILLQASGYKHWLWLQCLLWWIFGFNFEVIMYVFLYNTICLGSSHSKWIDIVDCIMLLWFICFVLLTYFLCIFASTMFVKMSCALTILTSRVVSWACIFVLGKPSINTVATINNFPSINSESQWISLFHTDVCSCDLVFFFVSFMRVCSHL